MKIEKEKKKAGPLARIKRRSTHQPWNIEIFLRNTLVYFRILPGLRTNFHLAQAPSLGGQNGRPSNDFRPQRHRLLSPLEGRAREGSAPKSAAYSFFNARLDRTAIHV